MPVRPAPVLLLMLALLFPPAAGVFPEGEDRPDLEITGSGGVPVRVGLREAEEVLAGPRENLYAEPYAYLLFLPGPLLFAVLLLMRRRLQRTTVLLVLGLLLLGSTSGSGTEQLVRTAVRAFADGRHAAALEAFLQAERDGVSSASLHYDIGLCRLALGERGRGIFRIRRAVRVAPQDRTLREDLHRIESALGLRNQVATGMAVHPNVPFVAILVLFNAAAVLFGVLYRFERGGLFILSVLTFAVLIGALVIFLFALHERGEPIAVVAGQEAPLKRVPLAEAREWILLPEGTALDVRGSAQGYVLVKTGLGLEGWIERNRLLFD